MEISEQSLARLNTSFSNFVWVYAVWVYAVCVCGCMLCVRVCVCVQVRAYVDYGATVL